MTTDNQKEDFDRFLVCGPKPKKKGNFSEKQLKKLKEIAAKKKS